MHVYIVIEQRNHTYANMQIMHTKNITTDL